MKEVRDPGVFICTHLQIKRFCSYLGEVPPNWRQPIFSEQSLYKSLGGDICEMNPNLCYCEHYTNIGDFSLSGMEKVT